MSWERGGGGGASGGPGGSDHRGDISDMFGGGERGRAGSNAGGSMVVGISGKRSKMDDDVGVNGPGGILASPASVNGRLGDGKKDGLKDGG